MFRLSLAALLFCACAPEVGYVPPPDDDGGVNMNPSDGGAKTDLAMQHPHDGSSPPAQDLVMNQGGPPMGGQVGPTGGAVDRLYFAFHGDTSPMNCNDTAGYPTAIIDNIYAREAALGHLQFDVSLGDYMFVCGGSEYTVANTMMGYYQNAAKQLAVQHFLVMGNHECEASGQCPVGSTDPNSTTFYNALKPVSPTAYYSFNITTHTGLATFVVVADNAWDNTQQSWLESTLTTADAKAKYTIVMRHHPIGNTDQPNNPVSWNIIHSHKYTL